MQAFSADADRSKRSRGSDGLLRFGNLPMSSPLTSSARLLRYTAGAAVRVSDNVRLKASAEYYQASSLRNDLALHIAVATPF